MLAALPSVGLAPPRFAALCQRLESLPTLPADGVCAGRAGGVGGTADARQPVDPDPDPDPGDVALARRGGEVALQLALDLATLLEHSCNGHEKQE
jgi:hypothetical protein